VCATNVCANLDGLSVGQWVYFKTIEKTFALSPNVGYIALHV